MGILEQIQAAIPGFGGYAETVCRRVSDEQIRAFAGESLACLSAVPPDRLSSEERDLYDRVLLRCEFMNQRAFCMFEENPTSKRIDGILAADLLVLDAANLVKGAIEGAFASALSKLENAFDARESAMIAE